MLNTLVLVPSLKLSNFQRGSDLDGVTLQTIMMLAIPGLQSRLGRIRVGSWLAGFHRLEDKTPVAM